MCKTIVLEFSASLKLVQDCSVVFQKQPHMNSIRYILWEN